MAKNKKETLAAARAKPKSKKRAAKAKNGDTLVDSKRYAPLSSFELCSGDKIKSKAKYVLRKRLGRGGMGEVWSGERQFTIEKPKKEIVIKQSVAIKVVTCGSDQPEAMALIGETQKLADLQHDNIAQLLGAGIAKSGKYTGRPYIALQKVDGPNLEELAKFHGLTEKNVTGHFKKTKSKKKPMQPKKTQPIVRIPEMILALIMYLQTRALSFCHERGLINRDISPQNTMIDRQHGFVKVIDFGIAEHKFILRYAQDLSGKPLFMAPELFIDPENPATELTDMFSLGMTIYTVSTGLNPFSLLKTEGSIQDILLHIVRNRPRNGGQMVTPLTDLIDDQKGDGVDPVFSKIISRAVAFDPKDRFSSMDELQSYLKEYLYSGGVGPTIDTIATYLGLIESWKKASNKKRSAQKIIKEIQLKKKDSVNFPFFAKLEQKLFRPLVLSPTAIAALNDGNNPAMAMVYKSYK